MSRFGNNTKSSKVCSQHLNLCLCSWCINRVIGNNFIISSTSDRNISRKNCSSYRRKGRLRSTGKRKFINDDQAIAASAAMGVDIIKTVTASPAEAERLGLTKAFVNSLATTPSTAPRLKKRDVSTLADKVFKS